MSRLRRIADRDRIFFITSNLLPQVPPFSPTERDLLLLNLDALRKQSALRLLGYVIMPDHVHLLLATDVDSISNLMHQWKFKTGFAIQRLRGKKGPLWQARYFDFICRRTRDVSSKLDYIRQNPVAAGLVAEPHSWRWSSVGFYSQSTVPPLIAGLPRLLRRSRRTSLARPLAPPVAHPSPVAHPFRGEAFPIPTSIVTTTQKLNHILALPRCVASSVVASETLRPEGLSYNDSACFLFSAMMSSTECDLTP